MSWFSSVEDEFSKIVDVFHSTHDKLDAFVKKMEGEVQAAEDALTAKMDVHKRAANVLSSLKTFLHI